ncbi:MULTISPECIES: hypothetical protein [unclassified Gordonia (in: high G+C Gram-positive bacteria)]|uniref:hypothetical protein n=1 Tax=unclassified Gordonia (in: high G+C Gram-positive bacteria) TaxID=2657482 RepID=UPI001F0E7BE0|nr:hypothetical protein [Gordonia sp. ABSL49_1]MCH5641043.1 hypothetical protein [Gordonia sp. ABSL49_1]
MTTDQPRVSMNADEADAVEQSLPVDPDDHDAVQQPVEVLGLEADEADIAEQAIPVTLDDSDDPRSQWSEETGDAAP